SFSLFHSSPVTTPSRVASLLLPTPSLQKQLQYSREMTVRYGPGAAKNNNNNSSMRTSSGASVNLDQLIPHASSMHILIQVAMRWTTETPSEEGRQQLLDLLLHGIARFGKGSPTENDEAMLPIYRMLVRHSRSLVSRGLLYSRLYDEKCYRDSAAFYRDWIEALMSEGSRSEVDAVIELAKANEATPKKMIDRCLGNLTENSFDLRERAMVVLGDVRQRVSTIVRQPNAPSAPHNFTAAELKFVLSSSKMSEVLLYLGAAVAPPAYLHLISERIGAIRVLAYEVEAEEAK
ncbi:hypothetical protein PFISCL1PPCAC_26965, partial [Pristionchus fissidentatus]